MTHPELKELDIPSQSERLFKETASIREMLQSLLPLLDLLKTPVSDQESGMIERLFDLMAEVREELRASRENTFNQQEELQKLQAEIAELKTQTAQDSRMLREMHSFLMGTGDTL